MAVLTRDRLPVRLTTLVGRDAEVAEVTGALERGRLLTLTGPGGTGKTRLALAAAQAVAARDAGRTVCWVELAPLSDPGIVAVTVAARLGVPETPGVQPAEAIAESVGDQPVLVVLDNCEHLTAAAAELVAQLLGLCPACTVLATSREPLGVEGERAWRVPPLRGGTAVELFEDRARLVAPAFTTDAATRDLVRQVCDRLDRLPLAIELAAARVRVLSVRQLAERLTDVLSVLTGGARSVPARHQTLRATLDWSHDLLTTAERAVFRRLAVFAGGFTLAAAERVTADADIPAWSVLDLMTKLADKSLLRADGERYQFLAVIREYAHEQLVAAGEAEQVGSAHLDYFTSRAEELGALVERATEGEIEKVLDQLDADKPNFRAALEFAREASDQEAALRIAGALGRYAYLRGHYGEVRQWLDDAVELGTADPLVPAPAALRASALLGGGRLAHLQCDYEPAVARLRAALALYRELGDRAGTAAALQSLGNVAREQGNYEHSSELHRQSLELARGGGDKRAEARARELFGFTAWLQGDLEQAGTECRAALAIFRDLSDAGGIAGSLMDLGVIARYAGDFAVARALLDDSLTLAESIGFREVIAWCLEQQALLALDQADQPPEDLARLLRRSYVIHSELRDRWRMTSVLEGLAAVCAGLGSDSSAARAARLLGAAQALRDTVGTAIAPVELFRHEATVAGARRVLGAAEFDVAFQRGLLAAHLDSDVHADIGPSAEPGAAAPTAAQAGGLRVRALGAAVAELAGTEVTAADWGYAKPRELMFLLVTSPPLSREQIGAALWPELSRQQLGNALHTALRELRRALGSPHWVVYGGGRYTFNRELSFACDVDEFESALSAAGQASPAAAALPMLQRALAAYGGDFLAGLACGEWGLARREELRRRFESALLAVARLHGAAGRHQAAASAFRRVIEHEPLNETAHRGLMTCWDALGETARAVRHYAELTALLRDRVGVDPAAETAALYARLVGGGTVESRAQQRTVESGAQQRTVKSRAQQP
ncbi:MAG TPA: BTAD domain-containing putative transcriptional regulator [Trebonia sp.]|nr:BTAD domain-containing putative transcriptional regulator [Trebonia sp.]